MSIAAKRECALMYPEIAVLDNDPDEIERWVHSHYDEHFRIIAAIAKQKNIRLQVLPINYLREDNFQSWLFQHQSLHNDMNSVLHIAGNDLLDVDFKNDEQRNAWAWLQAQEHYQATNKLGI